MSSTNPTKTQSAQPVSVQTVEPSVWPSEGTTCYYALRHCPVPVRQHIHAAGQLIDSVGYCLLDVSEPTVAEKKIHWWHEEIARLAAFEPRHPAAKYYLDFFSQLSAVERQQACSSLLQILSCHSEEKFNRLEDQTSFEQLLLTDGRARQMLMSLAHLKSGDSKSTDSKLTESENNKATNSDDARPASQPIRFAGNQSGDSQTADTSRTSAASPDTQASDNLVLGLGLFHRLATFHKLYHAGLPVWPDSLYTQYNLSPENIKQSDFKDNFAELQNNLFEQTIKRLEKVQLPSLDSSDENPRLHRDARLVTAIYSAIRLAQVRVWKKNRTNLLEQYRTVTPLKKAWICWRLQRQL